VKGINLSATRLDSLDSTSLGSFTSSNLVVLAGVAIFLMLFVVAYLLGCINAENESREMGLWGVFDKVVVRMEKVKSFCVNVGWYWATACPLLQVVPARES
jgi:hypothetical protein